MHRVQADDRRGAAALQRRATRNVVAGALQTPADLHAVLRRRSLTGVQEIPLSRETARALTTTLLQAMHAHDWLVVGLVAQGIEGVRPGCYLWQADPVWLDARRQDVPEDLIVRSVQGQGFVKGSGALYFLGVDWPRLATLGGSAATRYRDALVTVGAIGHALLLTAQTHGLSSRMTPAIQESTAAEIFQAPPEIEMLYTLKAGHAYDHH